MRLSSLSIFFPTLNDAPVLPELVAKADRVARVITNAYEIIVIDDGSTDDTPGVLKKLAKKYPRLRAVRHRYPSGYGGALRAGFAASNYDWVFYTDGDGQYDPNQLKKLASKLGPGIDVVNGYKVRRSDPMIRRVMGTLYNWALHRLYSIPIRDIDCDFRLIRRSLLKNIVLTSTSGVICLELICKLQKSGARFAEVGVRHYPRKHGTSAFFQFGNLYKTMEELVKATGYGSRWEVGTRR